VKFPFRVAKEVEMINDRLKFLQKEMAAKFKHGNVAFAQSDQTRHFVNSLMGQLNKYLYGIDSSQYSQDSITHCFLQTGFNFYALRQPVLKI